MTVAGYGATARHLKVISAREWIITACADGSAATWDANTGEWCKSLFGHDLHIGPKAWHGAMGGVELHWNFFVW